MTTSTLQNTLLVPTTRFGELRVAEAAVLEFPEGLPGFADQRRWLLVPHHGAGGVAPPAVPCEAERSAPFVWLQSAERLDLAFLMLAPAAAFPDYAPTLPADVGAASADVSLWVLLTVPAGDPRRMTANLLGPIVIERARRRGRQIVLGDERYHTRHPVFPAYRGGSSGSGA